MLGMFLQPAIILEAVTTQCPLLLSISLGEECHQPILQMQMELAWDLGPFAAVPPCLHPDTPLLEQRNTKKPSGTKNKGVHAQLGQILDPKDTKRLKNTTATFEEPGAKSRRLGVKAGYCSFSLATAPPKGWAKLLNHPSGPAPGHTPYKQQTQKGACCSCSPSGTTGAPLNPCLNFLSSL